MTSTRAWGDQMRNYVLNPYQMVKDLRTGYEVGNPPAVFDGDLDGFIEAGIRWRRGAERAAAQNSAADCWLAGAVPQRPNWRAGRSLRHRPAPRGRRGQQPRTVSL